METKDIIKYIVAVIFPPAIPTFLLLEENKLLKDYVYIWFGVVATITLIILTSLLWIPGVALALILIYQYKNYKPRE